MIYHRLGFQKFDSVSSSFTDPLWLFRSHPLRFWSSSRLYSGASRPLLHLSRRWILSFWFGNLFSSTVVLQQARSRRWSSQYLCWSSSSSRNLGSLVYPYRIVYLRLDSSLYQSSIHCTFDRCLYLLIRNWNHLHFFHPLPGLIRRCRRGFSFSIFNTNPWRWVWFLIKSSG